MIATPSPASTVNDFFTAEEWSRFIAAGHARAKENRTAFVLDESFRLHGEVVWADYIRDRMQRLGLRDLAAKIELDAFEIRVQEIPGVHLPWPSV